MIRLAALLLLLIPLQDPDPARLIEALGNPDAAVRGRASAELEKLGAAALPELRRAKDNPDIEVRNRALALIPRIEAAVRLQSLIQAQRPEWMKVPDPAPDELQGDVVKTEGVWFAFSRKPWAPDGRTLGTVFRTRLHSGQKLQIGWTVSVGADRPLPVETCSVHSPTVVYVPGDLGGVPVVTVKGTRYWTCDVPVEFKNPSEGMSRRVGAFELIVAWPNLEARSDVDFSAYRLRRALQSDEIQVKIKPGRVRAEVEEKLGIEAFGVGAGGGSGVNVLQKRAWCGCRERPSTEKSAPEAGIRAVVRSLPGCEGYKVDDVESITATFHLPIDEPFEVTSDPLK